MNLDELNSKLDAESEDLANIFLKNDGDMFAGTILKIGEFKHAEYDPAPALTVKTDDGTVISDGQAIENFGTGRVLLLGKLLQNFFEDEDLSVGDWIAVKHRGKKKSPSSGYSYNDFKMIVEKASAASKLASADF